MIEQSAFREAMARLGAAVNLVTTNGQGGRHGLIASAVCSVTDQPPTILICINRSSTAHCKLKTNSVLAVNVLATRHHAFSERFADRALSMDERFGNDVNWTISTTGCPILRDASVMLDCRIADTLEVGTHSVFFCRVENVQLHDAKGSLIYFDRAYHQLVALPPLV